jgi:hypothetical protein
MVRRCALVMDDAGRAELERLSRSDLRAEADRAGRCCGRLLARAAL